MISAHGSLTGNSWGVFFDYPYSNVNEKLEAPFGGDWESASNHSTSLSFSDDFTAHIRHDIGNTTYFITIQREGIASIDELDGMHRHLLLPQKRDNVLNSTVTYSPLPTKAPSAEKIMGESVSWWQAYRDSGAFVDLTTTGNSS
ncbi:MAG: hypothetical protein MMC23_009901, partial [Stictis urceolatum]|nr:hypothetical protein [Stictis urceolata]